MSYFTEYQTKLKTAEDAVKIVKAGDFVEYGLGICMPDVYKRQQGGSFDLFAGTVTLPNLDTDQSVTFTYENLERTVTIKAIPAGDESGVLLTPVSYTHLDVYKRQVHTSPTSRPSARWWRVPSSP